MRKLVETTFVSLDGVMSNPQDWAPPYWDDEYTAYERRGWSRSTACSWAGRPTTASRRPGRSAPETGRRPDELAAETGDLAGRPELTWNAQLLEGDDLVDSVRALKAQEGGDILKFGTGETDLTLLPAGLVDELHIWVFPVIAGDGGRLLEGLPVTHLDLQETARFGSLVVVLRFAGTTER